MIVFKQHHDLQVKERKMVRAFQNNGEKTRKFCVLYLRSARSLYCVNTSCRDMKTVSYFYGQEGSYRHKTFQISSFPGIKLVILSCVFCF